MLSLSDQKLEDIGNVVITQYHGNPILVKHVAKVVESYQPRLGIVGRKEGWKKENDVVEGIVLMRKYEKSLPVSEAVLKKIDDLTKRSSYRRECGSRFSTSVPSWCT